MKSFLKTFGKLLLGFGKLFFLLIVSEIVRSVNFGASTYALFIRKCLMNLCTTFTCMHCFLLTEAVVDRCSSKYQPHNIHRKTPVLESEVSF